MIPEEKKLMLIQIGLICAFIVVIGVFGFLAVKQFSAIDQEGILCINDPLAYTAYEIKEEKGIDMICSCQAPSEKMPLNISLNFTWDV